MTVTTPQQRRSPSQTAVYLGRRAIGMEFGVWLSLYRFIFRRPRVPAGAKGFTYHRPIMSIMIVFIVLSAVEIPIVDLIVHQWLFVRIPFLILGIWGLTFMTGFVFGFLTRPHAVGPEGIRVRNGAEIDIPISWDDVYSVEPNKQVAESAKELKVTRARAATRCTCAFRTRRTSSSGSSVLPSCVSRTARRPCGRSDCTPMSRSS